MSDDSIRNIQFHLSKSVYSVQGPNDRLLHKEKRKKKYKAKREKDRVELSEQPSSKKTIHHTEQNSVKSNEEAELPISINILVK